MRSGEVARILADLEASENCIAAALLHTALESSMLTEQKLQEAMCPEVCNIVCNVAKMSDICKASWQLYHPFPTHLLLRAETDVILSVSSFPSVCWNSSVLDLQIIEDIHQQDLHLHLQ